MGLRAGLFLALALLAIGCVKEPVFLQEVAGKHAAQLLIAEDPTKRKQATRLTPICAIDVSCLCVPQCVLASTKCLVLTCVLLLSLRRMQATFCLFRSEPIGVDRLPPPSWPHAK